MMANVRINILFESKTVNITYQPWLMLYMSCVCHAFASVHCLFVVTKGNG